jgi:uncharacterized membrane protein YdjX (TVP38/TMEM64 family)
LSKTKKSLIRTPWLWVAFVVGAAFIAFFIFSPAFKELVEDIASWVEAVMNSHPLLGALVFFLFSAFSAMIAFASSAVLVPSAIAAWGHVITFFLLWGGWMAGAAAAWRIGRLARPLLNRLGYEEELDSYQKWVGKRMPFWGVLLFCIAVPSEIPGYLFGSVRYSFVRFFAAMGIAEAIYAVGVIAVGENLLTDKPLPLLLAIAAIVLVGAGGGLLLKRMKRKQASKLAGG